MISGSLTASGEVIVANDPHRGVTNHRSGTSYTSMPPVGGRSARPSPYSPGVAIGHNGRVAWGLTIVGTDQSDVYIEDVHPDNGQRGPLER